MFLVDRNKHRWKLIHEKTMTQIAMCLSERTALEFSAAREMAELLDQWVNEHPCKELFCGDCLAKRTKAILERIQVGK